MNRNIRQTSAWCDLPSELLSIIGDLLDSDENLVKFRSVCKNWRSSTPPPLLVLDPSLPYRVKLNNCGNIFVTSKTNFTVVSTAVYLLRQRRDPSVEPWLVAVEQPRVGKLRLFHPLSRNPIRNLPENFPKVLANDDFSAVKLSQGFNIRLKGGVTPALLQREDDTNSFSVNKVVFWPYNPKTVVVLSCLRELIGFRLSDKGKVWNHISGIKSKIDDIILWRSMVWAVSRNGKLFGIDCNNMEVSLIGDNSNLRGLGLRLRRKRLFSNQSNELFLIMVTNGIIRDGFDVYKLSSQYRWMKLANLGHDTIVFVSFDTCFATRKQYFPGIEGNSIVFQKNSFPGYNNGYSDDPFFSKEEENDEYLQVGVCKYNAGKYFKLISALPGFSAVFWPPPQWILNPNEAAQQKRSGPRKDACNNNHRHENTNENTNADTIKFQGIAVSSWLVPTLENVWIKYGNIMDESGVSSCKAKATEALSLLVEVICILRRVRVNKFTDDQVNYLVSTMAKLQSMCLRVDWLVPFVEKAFVLHKSKPLAAALMELEKALELHKRKSLSTAFIEIEKAKAHAEEMRTKVSAEIENGCVRFEGSSKIVLESVLASELMDLDKFLGDGIL